ncbi:MAG: hypothetical protein LWX83_12180 [Anaerolineae bacterium]|nr:hypothetical protein [Anaerolineae bacterium]
MPLSTFDEKVESQIEILLQSKKYKSLLIPAETLRDLVSIELLNHRNEKEAVKSIRQKLHNIMAPYLGDPDYAAESKRLALFFNNPLPGEVKNACLPILQAHASTRERIPILDEFYQGIFEHTGQPKVILDLACALNPFSIPWMNLSAGTRYYAYDIHQPRLNLINQFLGHLGFETLAEKRDILINPPLVQADVAFLFKEAHRLEQRRRGCNLPLWQALNVRHFLVSLPASSLSGQHDLADRQRHLVKSIIGENPWKVTEMIFGNEMVFCIEKDA